MAILDYSSGLNQASGNTAGSRALGMMKGLGGLEAQRFNQQQAEAKVAQQEEQTARAQQARLQGAELLKSGTPDEIASFGMQNPDVMKEFIQAANFKDQTALKSRVKYAQDVLSSNVSPRAALISRIQEVEASGGDAQGLWQTLKLDDDGIKKAAEKDLAVISPNMYKSYKDAISAGQPEAMTEYQSAMIKGKDADRVLRQAEVENKKIDNQIKRETNKVKLDELKAKKKANEDKQEGIKKQKTEAALTVVDSGKSTLDLISEIESHPGFESAIGAKGVSSLFGALDSPFSGTDAAGVNALIETLEAQNFLTAIGEFKSAGGAGALSDNEGKKLGAALSNLSTSQSEKDFKKSLNVIRNLVKKQISNAKSNIDERFVLDRQEVGAPSANKLSDEELIKKYGG